MKHTLIVSIATDIKIFLDYLKKLTTMAGPILSALDHNITVPTTYKSNCKLVNLFNYLWNKNEYVTYPIGKNITGIVNLSLSIMEVLEEEAEKYLLPLLQKVDFKTNIPEIPYIVQIEKEFSEFKIIISPESINGISNKLDSFTYSSTELISSSNQIM